MNIVYAAHVPIPSHRAYAVHVMHMCSAFASLGHKVKLFSLPGISDPGETHLYYGLRNDFSITNIPQLKYRGISGIVFGWNIVQTCMIDSAPDLFYSRHIYAALFAYMKGWKVVYEVHMPVKNFLHKLILNLLSNRVKLVSITESLRSSYLSDFRHLKPDNIVVAPDGAVVPKNSIQLSSSRINNVGYIGNLFPGKGMELIIKISRLLPDVDFHIIGGRKEEVIHWKGECQGLNIIFYGQVKHSDLDEYYSLFDVCLLPLQSYVSPDGGKSDIAKWTSPMKMFEYMAHNKAIISSDLPVLLEVLSDNNNALIVSSSSPDEWVDAIKKLFYDYNFLSKLANNAFFDLNQKYTWNARCKKILSFLFA